MIEIERLDLLLFHALNGLSDQRVVSYGSWFLQGTSLGTILMMAGLWWFWFKEKRHQGPILAILIGVIASIIIARLMANLMPFRLRPMYTSGIEYQAPQLPESVGAFRQEDWSAFPSDHAALYFAIAYGLWRLSRPAGIAAFSFAILAGGAARIILGIHYPLDVIAGGLVGISAVAASLWLTKAVHFQHVLFIKDEYPYVFYSSMFLITVEISTVFYDIRLFARGIRIVLRDFGYKSLGLFEALMLGAAGLLALAATLVCLLWGIGWLKKLYWRMHP
jgi:membrane-associated phospholipid phosphatase